MNSIRIKKAPRVSQTKRAILIINNNYMKKTLEIIGNQQGYKLMLQERNPKGLVCKSKVLYEGTSKSECYFHQLRYQQKMDNQSLEDKQAAAGKKFSGIDISPEEAGHDA